MAEAAAILFGLNNWCVTKGYRELEQRLRDQNMDEISDEVHSTLKMVYLSLFCAMVSITCGSTLHWILIAAGKYSVLYYVANLILLYLTPPERVNMRIVTSMLAAYSFGSSVGFIFNYLFKIEQLFVLRFFGWYKQLALEICCIKPSNQRIGGKSTPIHTVLILFMGYLVIYSHEILYDANFGDIDFVICTFTVFYHFPGIMIHATRLYLQGEQQEQN
ncbi:bax inhibitor 1-like [Solanum tuberosum]|uniref:bax inhibitor 1-like n=1 Tax=Solanum tuberosum TaxID=4113 RepID=UPI00073A3064|nr:PREDICTED: bax inhibitor 1-like [Solanum tuberosum]